jgi:hypothetical protein
MDLMYTDEVVLRLSFPLMLTWLALVTAGCGSKSAAPVESNAGTGGSGGAPGSSEPVLDGGGEIAMPPDGPSLCPVGACNYQTGEGCSGNLSCVPLPASGAGSGVVPSCETSGQVAAGGVCTSWTDCARGMICAVGHCRKLCCGTPVLGDWNGCSAGDHCLRPLVLQIGADASTVATGAYLCFPARACDPLEPSSTCPTLEPGTTCQLADPAGASACLPEGTGTPGQPCPCKGGFTCVARGCRRLCRAVAGGGEPSCPAAEGTCVHFNRDPDGVGECTPR